MGCVNTHRKDPHRYNLQGAMGARKYPGNKVLLTKFASLSSFRLSGVSKGQELGAEFGPILRIEPRSCEDGRLESPYRMRPRE